MLTFRWIGRLVTPLFVCCALPLADAGELEPGLYARIETTKGTILCRLEFKKTPLTVMNFVGLAEGSLPVDPAADLPRVRQMIEHMRRENEQVKRAGDPTQAAANTQAIADAEKRAANLPKTGQPYYNGIVFHRVIADFMVQVGDPYGLGVGGPGYRFDDEIRRDLKHDRAGTLSMANAGPGTNGSQFFITHKATPHLDGKHSVFGYVVSGQDVVDKIRTGDSIRSVRIQRVGPEAEAFLPTAEKFEALKGRASDGQPSSSVAGAFNAKSVLALLEKNRALLADDADAAEDLARLDTMIRRVGDAQAAPGGGLLYVVLKEGKGEPIGNGKKVSAHYTGYLPTGELFDTSLEPRRPGQQPEPFEVVSGAKQVITGWDQTLRDMKVGEKRAIFLPPGLAYGARGTPGGPIPPNATLYFELEILKAD